MLGGLGAWALRPGRPYSLSAGSTSELRILGNNNVLCAVMTTRRGRRYLPPQPPMKRCWEPAGLPEVIWSHIASHLSVQQYARVSGTCKLFSHLRPEMPSVCLRVDARLRDEGMPTCLSWFSE